MFLNNQTFTLQNLPLIYQLDLLWFELMVWMESFSWFFVAFTSFVKKQTTKWFKVNDLTICWLPKLVWTWVMLSNLIATFSLQRKLWLKRKEKKVKTKAGKNHSMTFYKVRRESVIRDRGKICMYMEISTPKWTSFSKVRKKYF